MPTVLADADSVVRVLENLFQNAVEHGGDDVTVRVGWLEDADGFYVEDDGVGLAAGARTDLFEWGQTGSDAGHGLGLAIVQHIVDAHDWQIKATNAASGGARFEITGVDRL